MIAAAVYSRKSSEQNGADQDAKSVARQIENAKAFAKAKGWTVPDAFVFSDDAISGAETKRLVNRQRMLDAIKNGPPFQVLIMRDTSRFSRRDGDESFGELKAIAKAGVEVWFYLDQSRFAYGNFGDNIKSYVNGEMAAEYRRQIAKLTAESHLRKAQQGHVTGNRTFGYDNIRVNGHVERRINEREAAVVARIYELYATGHGLPTIAHMLNNEGAACPRAQQGRVNGWRPSSVRSILKRPLYVGRIEYGKTKKRNDEGRVAPTRRPASAIVRVDKPDLRVVPDDVARAVEARQKTMHTRALRQANGRLIGRPPGEGSPYLLTGVLACGTCGGGMEVLSSSSGKRRLYHYRCQVARRKGPACCTNRLAAPMADADAAVLRAVEQTLLNPAVLTRALDYAETALTLDRSADQIDVLEADLNETETAIRRLTAAIVAGGELGALVEGLATYERRRTDLTTRLAAARAPKTTPDAKAIRRTLEGYLRDYQGLLRGHVHQGQQVLRRLILGRLTFTPTADGFYTFEGKGTVKPLLVGAIHKLASPAGFDTRYPDNFEGIWVSDRAA